MNEIKILIVDDIKENLLSLELLLENDEMEIITASSGQEALQKTLDHNFFLILMDVQMPGMNGYEAAELLRGNKRTRNIPIIFVTANSRDEENLFQGYEAGAVDYLVKPIAPRVLESKINIFKTLYLQQLELMSKTSELNGIISEMEELHQELEEKNKQLEILSSMDGLTGLYNRRYFDLFLEEEWNRAYRHGHPVSLVMGDIDRFKAFNDRYGHVKGDECLEKVASLFANTFQRCMDKVARYGGEEFIALLPETDITSAEGLAEKLLDMVRDARIPHKDSQHNGIVTISLGVCTAIPSEKMNPLNFLKIVDEALYEAKNGGRNRYSRLEYVAE
ncbi:MAG: diguanylate cyclase [Spirochaetales bacterium]|nr:diguanylate cyclase [Spirochaetales bacterium]